MLQSSCRACKVHQHCVPPKGSSWQIELGYQNRDFHQTIADTIAWLEEHHRIRS